jgi:glycosyltransferase involved in cell wall biosynthesis
MRVAYILGSRIPTSKAYGVTCRETVKVLIRETHLVRVYGYSSRYTDADFQFMEKLIEPLNSSFLSRFLRAQGGKGVSNLHKIFWKIGLSIDFYANVRKFLEFSPDYFWTRNPEIAIFLLRKVPKSKVILEVHYRSRLITSKKFIKYIDRVLFCPINSDLERYTCSINQKFSVFQAPMSIDMSYLATENEVKGFIKSLNNVDNQGLNVGYVGKFTPGGYSKGIEDLVNLGIFYHSIKSKSVVHIVGGDTTEVQTLKEILSQMGDAALQINVSGHLSHSEAIEVMKSMDVLILPLPRSSKYDGSPIKSLEYCAVGKIVIAAKSDIYEQIFTAEYQPFWYKGQSSESLHNEIQNALLSSNLQERILAGVNYASKYTWESRTRAILGRVENL